MPMTLLMWILLSGSILGLIFMAICAIARKPVGIKISLVTCLLCLIAFVAYTLPKLQNYENHITVPEETIGSATFEEIYKAYKENELVADDLYKDNRYQITAKINGISSTGIFNLTGGATLTLEKEVGNTIVFFYAEFEKEQEENLKTVKVGDTITFVGKCLSAGSWSECELVEE